MVPKSWNGQNWVDPPTTTTGGELHTLHNIAHVSTCKFVEAIAPLNYIYIFGDVVQKEMGFNSPVADSKMHVDSTLWRDGVKRRLSGLLQVLPYAADVIYDKYDV